MRVVVIGGSGHIGTFLIPRLVRAGHDVVAISRGTSRAYIDAPEWAAVQQVAADRQQEDRDGVFGDRIVALRPDVVVDLLCFTLDSAVALVDRLRGTTGQLVHCGSIWRYGPSRKVPITEDAVDAAGPPFDEYGIQKQQIAAMLNEETAAGGLLTTSIHPGHIVGPGWHPTGPLGNVNPDVWYAISAGRSLQVPGSGTETMHHVHADDLAQAFELAITHREQAAGEDFNVVAPAALSVRGYVEIAAAWFGQTVTLETVSWEQFRATVSANDAQGSWGHLHRSHCFSIEKARTLLGYAPRYQPEDAILESIRWLIDHNQLDVARPITA
ncbi:MAG: NAD-dependent epimerase/dehydratase family protein [Thermomicrobiales bacterium]|jgi:nucleoside-diphosphate-sugar epimerase